MGLLPDFRLVGADPVGFRFGLQVGDRIASLPARANSIPHIPLTGGSPVVRRWSSQMMAGRRAFAAGIHIDHRAALGVSATAAMLSLAMPGCCHKPLAGLAHASQKTDRCCSARPGALEK